MKNSLIFFLHQQSILFRFGEFFFSFAFNSSCVFMQFAFNGFFNMALCIHRFCIYWIFGVMGFCEMFLSPVKIPRKLREKLEILKSSPDLDNENSHKN